MKSKIYRYFINAGLNRSNFNGKDVNCENKESWKKKTFIAKQRTLTINFELENHVKLQQQIKKKKKTLIERLSTLVLSGSILTSCGQRLHPIQSECEPLLLLSLHFLNISFNKLVI